MVSTSGGDKKQEFFTNAEGRFRISRMAPGTYSLRLYQYPDLNVRLVIPNIGTGRFDVGTITLTGEGS